MIPSDNLPAAGGPQLVDSWRAHLRDAQQSYRAAVEFSNRARNATQNPNACPDDVEAYYRALLHENAALCEYMRILRIYTDLVVSGKAPED